MVAFRGISLDKVVMLLLFGYVTILVSVNLAQEFGWIPAEANVGAGFAIIAAGMAMVLAYVVIVKKQLSLSFREFLTIFLLVGMVIAVLVIIPGLAPDQMEASFIQLKVATQSIIG